MWTAVVATSVSNFLSLLLKSKYKLKIQRRRVWLWAGNYLVLKPERSWLIWEHACLEYTGMCPNCFPKATEGGMLESNWCPRIPRRRKGGSPGLVAEGQESGCFGERPQEQPLLCFPEVPFINQQLLWAESPQFESSLSRDKILSAISVKHLWAKRPDQVLCLCCRA